jgi:Fe-S-cluster containining protein
VPNELVQIGETPVMALCSLCPEPGHCCKKFALSLGGYSKREDWVGQARQELRDRGLPFQPLTIQRDYAVEDQNSPDFRSERVTLYFYCPKLSKDGRCTIYPFRPDVCRVFVPASDTLCVFHGL